MTIAIDDLMNEAAANILDMTKVRRLTIYGNPRGKGRPRFSRGHTYTDAATVEYEKRVRKLWDEKNGTFWLDKKPTTVIIFAWFKVPVSLSKKKREAMFGTPHLKKPDGDNIAKIVVDALNGVAYADDSQIDTLMVFKQYVTSDEDRPRVDVIVFGSDSGCLI